MRRITRMLAVFLVLVLLTQGVAPGVLAAAPGAKARLEDPVPAAPKEASEETAEAPGEPFVQGELAERRGEQEKHFRMSDGSFLAVDYGVPVHYSPDGETWENIDNTLLLREEAKDAGSSAHYAAENGEHSSSFAASLESGALFSVSFQDAAVRVALADAPDGQPFNRASEAEITQPEKLTESSGERTLAQQLRPALLESSVLYRDVWPGADLRYLLSGYNVKESIVLNEPCENCAFSFVLSLDALTPELAEDGSIELLDAEGRAAYRIPTPYMTDADGALSNAVSYTLTQREDGWLLTVAADPEWLGAEGRAYPVEIDPTVIDLSSGTDFSGRSVGSNSNPGSTSLVCGYHPTYGQTELYFKLNSFPAVPNGNELVAAYVGMLQNDYRPTNGSGSLTLTVSACTQNVANYSTLTWGTKPALGEALDYTSASYGTINSLLTWDITREAKLWYADSSANHGLAMTSDATASSAKRAWFSYTNVYFIVSYRNVMGIESYYTYQTLSADRAGTAYVSDYTGWLTTVTPLSGLASSVNPFTVNLVYNSTYFLHSSANVDVASVLGLTDMHFGSGMKLNLVQKMETIGLQCEIGNSNTKTYLKYTDGDGTAHYFDTDAEKDPTLNTYYDEDDLNLEAVIDNASTHSFTITDKKDNRMEFVQNYLYKIIDANGNEIKIVYNTGNGKPAASARISSVVQTNSGQSPITIASFTYAVHGGVDGYLYQVTDHAGNVYRLYYSNGKLRKLYRKGAGETAETEIVEFFQKYENNINNNPITGLLDKVSGYELWFTYDGYDHGRIDSYYEKAGGNLGAHVSITRCPGEKTVYQDWGLDRQQNTADDLFTTCLFDNCGRSVNTYTALYSGAIVGAANVVYSGSGSTDRANNRPLQTAGIGTPGMSMVRNGSFEASGSSYLWTLDTGGLASSLTNAVISTDQRLTGEKALKLYLSPTVTDDVVLGAHRSSYSLTAGKTYTVSAYVNTTAANYAPDGKGLYLKVTGSGLTDCVGEKLNYQTDAQINGGWARIKLTFTAASSGAHTLWLCNDGMSGVVYFDDVQLEQNDAPSSRNLLDNGGLHLQTGWTFTNSTTNDKITSGETPGVPGIGSYVIRLIGDPGVSKTAYQRVTVNQPGSRTYVLSGWAKANAVPDNLTVATGDDAAAKDAYKQFGLRAVLTYTDSTIEYHFTAFDPDVTDWQFASLTIVPKEAAKTVQYIDVVCCYQRNANAASFAGLSLVKELAQTMRYDEDGNLQSVKSTDTGENTATYDGGDLTHEVTAGSGSFDYDYDSSHNLTSATNGVITQENTYNGVGNTTATELRSNSSGFNQTISSSATYSYSQNLPASMTDSRGCTSSSSYAGTLNRMLGLASETVDAKGTHSYATFYNDGRANLRYLSGVISETRAYDAATQRLTAITRGGYIPGNSTKQNQIYGFTYDSFGNVTGISVGSRDLASYSYGSVNGLLQQMSYGNGATVSYAYDALGRKTQTSTSSGDSYDYRYTGDGQLYEMNDVGGGLSYRYQYDSIGRLVGSELRTGENVLLQTWQEYDDAGRAASQSWRMGDERFREGYTYDGHGRLTQKALTLPNNASANLSLTYDGLSRLSSVTSPVSADSYTYAAGSGTNGTTGLISGMSHNAVSGSSLSAMYFTYQYDALGNITQQAQTGLGTTSYTYDVQSQLTQANRGSGDYIWNYGYDSYGNLRSRDYRIGGVVQDSVAYSYGDTDWLDLLTAVSGTKGGVSFSGAYSYDNAGNPTSYYNLADGASWTLTWRNGRELATAGKSGVSLSFEYDVNGLRTSKTRSTTNRHEYLYAGGKPVQDKYVYSGYIYYLDFLYDASGRPYALYETHDGVSRLYYYLLNAQGDVVRLVASDGATVANYDYDPYGALLSVTNANGSAITSPTHIANLNPLRYRGYYYDTETGWYYLQSRYYDPALCRFLNADSYASTGQGFLGYNMFAYCGNGPVNARDPGGHQMMRNSNVMMTDGPGSRIVPKITYVGDKSSLTDEQVVYCVMQHSSGAVYSVDVKDNGIIYYEGKSSASRIAGGIWAGASFLGICNSKAGTALAILGFGRWLFQKDFEDWEYGIGCSFRGGEKVKAGRYHLYQVEAITVNIENDYPCGKQMPVYLIEMGLLVDLYDNTVYVEWSKSTCIDD